MSKSATDVHWNERAVNEKNPAAVNIADISQRELETQFLLKHLLPSDRILEVGCGNGFLTNTLRQKVSHVDAFDYAENMIEKAKDIYGEKNNRFFHDNVLAPSNWQNQYDAIVCVRVLINLRDFEEQKVAVENMRTALRPGGRLFLVEGYRDGFDALNRLRVASGIDPLVPASINFYSGLEAMRSELNKGFGVGDDFHTGSFDYLTRVVYPALVGAANASGHSEFHAKILPLAMAFNPDQFRPLARLHGFLLTKK